MILKGIDYNKLTSQTLKSCEINSKRDLIQYDFTVVLRPYLTLQPNHKTYLIDEPNSTLNLIFLVKDEKVPIYFMGFKEGE